MGRNDHLFRSQEFEFAVYGDTALFTDPIKKLDGEKFSYPYPTYEALKGIVKAIYWKPTFIWVIDRVRIMNEIVNRTVPVRTIKYNDASTTARSFYSYLENVCYHVQAHYEWNMNRPELKHDRIEGKHTTIFIDALEKGGRRNIYLGASECSAYVEPCRFESGKSFYDDKDIVFYGMPMFHSFTYADEAFSEETKGKVTKSFWIPEMRNGVITFPSAKECDMRVEFAKQDNVKMFSKNGSHYEKSKSFYRRAKGGGHNGMAKGTR